MKVNNNGLLASKDDFNFCLVGNNLFEQGQRVKVRDIYWSVDNVKSHNEFTTLELIGTEEDNYNEELTIIID